MLDLVFLWFCLRGVLFIVSLSFVECSAGCGLNSIVCVFKELRIRLFCFVQLNMSCRCECTCCGCIYVRVGRDNRDVIRICY